MQPYTLTVFFLNCIVISQMKVSLSLSLSLIMTAFYYIECV
jgi:hypothetical protein